MPALLLYYYTFQGTLLEDLKCSLFLGGLLAFFMYYLYEMYYEPITVQYYKPIVLLEYVGQLC